jgi:hypothetical protein
MSARTDHLRQLAERLLASKDDEEVLTLSRELKTALHDYVEELRRKAALAVLN